MFMLDKSQKRWETWPSQRYHRYCIPTNWHRNIRDNFARLPHPHHPAQKCWNQTQSSGPNLPALTRNRTIPWHHIRLACFCNNFTSLTLTLTYNHHTTVFLSSLQSLSSCSQVSHFSMPQLALLNIPVCAVPKMPSRQFLTLQLKMLLSSDPNL